MKKKLLKLLAVLALLGLFAGFGVLVIDGWVRLSTKNSILTPEEAAALEDADCILVLDDEGAIAGKGKHSELLQTCGIYREIVSSQLSAEEAGL